MKTPVVLGHEGSGIVREVGAGVTSLRRDDRVVFCWAPACGVCPPCREGRSILCDRVEKVTYRNRLPSGGARLHARDRAIAPFLGTACFADFAVVPEGGAIRVSPEVSFEALATVGCAVVTGVGAVRNAARVAPGSRVAVIGAGGVGLNVVQGAAIAGCAMVIAVDVRPAPLEIAKRFGATHVLTGTDTTVDAVRDLTDGRGADVVFDTVGLQRTLTEALACARKGGTVVLTGLAHVQTRAAFPMFQFVMQEKRVIGSVYGSGQPSRDIPDLISLHQAGRLKLHELVSRTYPLSGINEALADLESSAGARGVITW
jgi:S-(hydroxymethyl)glutathione dehydrogenase / alcohol dehydrogenase